MKRSWVVGVAAVLLWTAAPALHAQGNPIAPQQPRGHGVSPSFNGWYRNADGSYTLSFGFINRNTEELVTIPVGARNFVEPGPVDQGQPTSFPPGRQFGVFTVTVPATFSRDDQVVWTLEANGERYAIPGGLLPSYDIPALYNPSTDRAGVFGSRPPVLLLEQGGKEARGPAGTQIGPLSARVGRPLQLQVWAWDENDEGVTDRALTLRWSRYRGPGEVSFGQATLPVRGADSPATTTAMFSTPGEYVLHVQAYHTAIGMSNAGHAQCCWTNGYVRVLVEP
jgi:hypothetical protein